MRRFMTNLVFILLICFLAACQSGEGRSGPVQTIAVTIVPTSTVEEIEATPVEEAEATPVEEIEATPVEEIEATPVEETDATSETTVPYPPPYPEPSIDDPYPDSETDDVTASNSDESLPEVSNGPFEVSLPTDSTKANIGGTLLKETAQGEQPFERAVLYLGHLVLDSNGEKSAAGFFEQSSPRTMTNGAGHFLFENIEPGEYVLFYWTPQGSLMLLEPGSDDDMIFDLKAGEGVDTGRLAYDLPN